MEENKNIWVLVLAAIALLFLFGSFGIVGYGMMGFGFLFMLLFWGVLIWMAVTFINSSQSGKKEDDTSNILKKRYALGEITKKQYEEMKKKLVRR